MKVKLINTNIRFLVGKSEYEFNVKHNLPEFGNDMETAVMSWIPRTKNYTVQSLCDYITSKDPMIVCVPHEDVTELLSIVNN